eukprot:TRINITY_DN15519_c0_g1_i1.p1 TRINITY_DN15519_c0_g1~~TRINITY_DN15519_c0_g1_i1.p1  ORF type:complete len:390 (+),score=29.67 TRINITY_DN15519_c0_g1_i1:70-1239(+)
MGGQRPPLGQKSGASLVSSPRSRTHVRRCSGSSAPAIGGPRRRPRRGSGSSAGSAATPSKSAAPNPPRRSHHHDHLVGEDKVLWEALLNASLRAQLGSPLPQPAAPGGLQRRASNASQSRPGSRRGSAVSFVDSERCSTPRVCSSPSTVPGSPPLATSEPGSTGAAPMWPRPPPARGAAGEYPAPQSDAMSASQQLSPRPRRPPPCPARGWVGAPRLQRDSPLPGCRPPSRSGACRESARPRSACSPWRGRLLPQRRPKLRFRPGLEWWETPRGWTMSKRAQLASARREEHAGRSTLAALERRRRRAMQESFWQPRHLVIPLRAPTPDSGAEQRLWYERLVQQLRRDGGARCDPLAVAMGSPPRSSTSAAFSGPHGAFPSPVPESGAAP